MIAHFWIQQRRCKLSCDNSIISAQIPRTPTGDSKRKRLRRWCCPSIEFPSIPVSCHAVPAVPAAPAQLNPRHPTSFARPSPRRPQSSSLVAPSSPPSPRLHPAYPPPSPAMTSCTRSPPRPHPDDSITASVPSSARARRTRDANDPGQSRSVLYRVKNVHESKVTRNE